MFKKIKELTPQEFLEAQYCYNKSGVINCQNCKLLRHVKKDNQVVLDPICPCSCEDYKEIYGEDEIEVDDKIIKKRIKDLTLEEIEKICEKHFSCGDCPLAIHSKMIYSDSTYICLKEKGVLEELNKEIDVE